MEAGCRLEEAGEMNLETLQLLDSRASEITNTILFQ